MVTTSKTGSLKEAFNATGITFGGQSMEDVSADLRDDARLEEQAQEKKLQQLDDDFARLSPDENGEVSAPGRIGTGAAQNKAQEINQNQKKDKELTHFLNTLQQQRIEFERQINWTIKYLEQKAEEAEVQAGKLRQTIVDNIEKMQENSNFIASVDKLLKAHKAGEPFDKEQLRKLLKDKGGDIDDTTSLPVLLRTAEKMVVEADEENAVLEVDNEIHDKNAGKLETLQETCSAQAKDLKSKLDELKAQGLSEEEYQKQADEILERVSKDVKEAYGKRYGDQEADKQTVEDYPTAKEHEESFDFFAEQPDASIETNKMDQPSSPNNSMPTPSGM